VVCQPSTSRCDNGNACNGVGTICGHPLAPDGGPARLPDGGVFTVNTNSNCCDGKGSVCKVDSSGVPRCFGGCSPSDVCSPGCPLGYTGQSPCCITAGANCQLSGQCCDGKLCLPTDGGFACSAPTCKAVGASCTVGSTDCCPGTSCLLAAGGSYVCQPQGGQSDGGPQCAANGGSCSSGTDCCSGICNGNVCQAPATCQPQTYQCTSTADCCSGLVCNIPGGSTVGTCQPNSVGCQGAGQPCSTTRTCCTGSTCVSLSTFLVCTASDPSCGCIANLN
jgi:hypothetical protein